MDKSDDRVIGGLGEARRVQEAGAGAGRAPTRSPEVNAKRLENGEAWEEFCDQLRDAGRLILEAEQPEAPGVRAEGFRYLLGLVKVGIAQAGELADRDRPKWLRVQDSFSKWGAENADNHYLTTHIRGDTTYRISGTRGSCFTFLIEVREGFMQLGDTRDFANLTAEDVEVDADGRFEIIASPERQPGNWLPLDPEARQIVIRQYFKDWENEVPATFQIERIDDAGEPPDPLASAEMAGVLDDAAHWVRTSTDFWGTWIPELRARHRPGEIVPAVRYVGGADDIYYGNDYYRLAESDVMIVELTPPNARYWAFQLCDLWFVSTDYANRLTSLNDSQLRLDGDGKCRIVVAHEDPGVPNWLDTAGATQGCLQYRYIWTEDNPLPSVRSVPFAKLREALPSDTPTVSPESRRRTLQGRRRAIARREQLG
ncbi:MAG: DUF1214 domain-containing protein [Deltaproteobacteria bacterium]|jgi:hypothetical protein|nr:DUF1214 domain-containing protein [Deltaproteobacteria bacterium]